MAGRGKGFSLTRFNLLHSISIRSPFSILPTQLIAGELIVISRCLRGYIWYGISAAFEYLSFESLGVRVCLLPR